MIESELRIPAAIFVAEIKKIVHGWEITIEPKDFTEHPELYRSVTVTVSSQDNKITRNVSVPLIFTHTPPSHYVVLISNIASMICKETKENDLELCQKINNQFTEYFEKQR